MFKHNVPPDAAVFSFSFKECSTVSTCKQDLLTAARYATCGNSTMLTWMSLMCFRAEEEAIKQAMQDATLREQAQADRDRIRQVRASFLPSCSHNIYVCLIVCVHA